ncbi:MAG: class I SAM-dependent methyltransferase [Shewanella sp.]|jgi:ubiquinone/menaquinone biosynthesis C-methylase UbiE|nr:class I SAM-dependent methyltransferase [Arenimonas sp.]
MPSETEYVPALRFKWLTRYYDVVIAYSTREKTFKRALINQAGIESGMQVLDLASGTGTLAIWIKQQYPSAIVTGVDGDSDILTLAASKAQHANVDVTFDRALSFDLPYSENQFDRIVSSLFFHHLTWENKQATAAELYRILKPGAHLHIADWGRPANKIMRLLFLPVQILDGFKNTQENAKGRLSEIFEKAGFEHVVQKQSVNTILGTMVIYSAYKNKN